MTHSVENTRERMGSRHQGKRDMARSNARLKCDTAGTMELRGPGGRGKVGHPFVLSLMVKGSHVPSGKTVHTC